MKGESIPKTSVKLFDEARTLGTRIMAEAGTGKSALMGWLAFADFLKNIPVVIWDHNGGLVDNFFKLVETSKYRERLRPRIRYIELGNPDFAYGLPFYYDAGGDDSFTMSQRIIDIMVKLDPDLKSAPILGESSLIQIGTSVGMILSAAVDAEGNRWQITEAAELLLHYKEIFWRRIRDQVKAKVPTAEKFFLESYNQWSENEQRERRFRSRGGYGRTSTFRRSERWSDRVSRRLAGTKWIAII